MSEKKIIYLISDGTHYKIGQSKNIEERLVSLRTASSREISLVAYVITFKANSLEKEIHNAFSYKRIRGEWFSLNNEDVEWLVKVYNMEYAQAIKKPITQSLSTQQKNKRYEEEAALRKCQILYSDCKDKYGLRSILSEQDQVIIYKSVFAFGDEVALECMNFLCGKQPPNKVMSQFWHCCNNYSKYGRHKNEIDWNLYYAVREEYGREIATTFSDLYMPYVFEDIKSFLRYVISLISEGHYPNFLQIIENYLNKNSDPAYVPEVLVDNNEEEEEEDEEEEYESEEDREYREIEEQSELRRMTMNNEH